MYGSLHLVIAQILQFIASRQQSQKAGLNYGTATDLYIGIAKVSQKQTAITGIMLMALLQCGRL